MRTVKISRRAFLTGLGLASTAALLSACNTVPASSNSGAAPSQPDSEAPASSAASEVPAQPILSVDEFPITDGSTACIPLIAQIMADTTGLDLETARSAVTTNTTAQAWRNLGLYGNNYGDSVKLIIAYEAPESVKEELKTDGDPLEQKAIGRDALVFIVNEDNPVQSLTLQQLKDIYAGTITNWKDVGGKDQEIIAFQRRADSGSQTLFQKLLIQGGPLMHVIAAKAVCFKEALSDDFKIYAQGVIDNAQALCSGLTKRGIRIVSGKTENHLMLVDLTNLGKTGKEAENLLDEVNITCNKNTIPNDPKSAFVTSGVRLGTAAVTSRGMNTEDMDVIAEAIAIVLKEEENAAKRAKALVKGLTEKYPLI